MNMFFAYEDRIVTAPLDGSILHGITRDSVLKLVRVIWSEGGGAKDRRRRADDRHPFRKIKEAFGSGDRGSHNSVGSSLLQG